MPWMIVLIACAIIWAVVYYLEKKKRQYDDIASWQNTYDEFYANQDGYKPYAWRNYRKRK